MEGSRISIEQWSFDDDGEHIRGIIESDLSDPEIGDVDSRDGLVYLTTFPIEKIKYVPSTETFRAYDEDSREFDLGYPNVYFIVSTAAHLEGYRPLNGPLICRYLLRECQIQARGDFKVIKTFASDIEYESASDYDDDEDMFYSSGEE